jgi:release factor H-coupled RctB family protein
LGQSILEGTVREHGDRPLNTEDFALKRYLAKHDAAVGWARDNRRIIGERFLRAIRTTGELALDLTHNSVSVRGKQFLHRKGAAPADTGLVVIPGSRGAHSYLVKPTPLAAESDLSAWSLAHGAGRRWKRSECKARLSEKFSVEDLERTSLGSRVICGDRALLYEEAPQAYKDVDGVVEDLRSAGLITLGARLTPVLTFKKVS